MTPAIIGWSHGVFGKFDERSLEDLIVEAATNAIADANLTPADIDEIILGHFNAGFSDQSFTASLVLQTHPDLRFKPATRVENACASGSAAVFHGARAVESGSARVVLVVGAEKMTDTKGAAVGENLLRASYVAEERAIDAGFAGMFGKVAAAYFDRYGEKSSALAMIAAKNHRNGLENPLAQFRKDLGFEFCLQVSERNPIVAGPLKRTDCSPVSDGAAALVIADLDRLSDVRRAVRFRGRSHVHDFLPMSKRDVLALEGCRRAWENARTAAGVVLDDLSLVETHDCFTIAELLQYEAMGLTPPGEGSRAIELGWTDKGGRLPVNPSGGLKSKGHPIGATGVSMHVLSAMQLCDECPEGMQIPGASLAGVFNMGGMGVANYASILERVR